MSRPRGLPSEPRDITDAMAEAAQRALDEVRQLIDTEAVRLITERRDLGQNSTGAFYGINQLATRLLAALQDRGADREDVTAEASRAVISTTPEDQRRASGHCRAVRLPSSEPCGEPVALYGVAYGDLYDPCAKPKGHDGAHDPSAPASAVPETRDLRGKIEAIPHPCHEACIGELHADCQCAAWMRQEALAALTPTDEEAPR